MGATKDLYRWAAAAAPELDLTELVVEDRRRSALMRQARAVTTRATRNVLQYNRDFNKR